jgi:uncharacterized Zn-binding protein involved in type VI secretion
MGQPAAKRGDSITASDTHLTQVGQVTSLTPGHVFNGTIDGGLSADVTIGGQPAATVDSTATNTPPHVPLTGVFVSPPSNKGRIIRGSSTVTINGRAAARAGDTAETCNDPRDAPVGTVLAAGTVTIGG